MFDINTGTAITSIGTSSSGTISSFSVGSSAANVLIPTSNYFPLTYNNMNTVQNQLVAIFKLERNDKNQITSAKFIKQMWVETKNGSSVDFEVAKDSEINKYDSSEISIKVIHTFNF